jgi:DedD protein
MPADAAGQWVVQLGAYKDAGNVKLLLSKLKGINVPAYTEKYDSPQGPRTRVRAGPFASQEAAEKARARIKIIGVDGPVAPK